jgi:hypothetical protein
MGVQRICWRFWSINEIPKAISSGASIDLPNARLIRYLWMPNPMTDKRGTPTMRLKMGSIPRRVIAA